MILLGVEPPELRPNFVKRSGDAHWQGLRPTHRLSLILALTEMPNHIVYNLLPFELIDGLPSFRL